MYYIYGSVQVYIYIYVYAGQLQLLAFRSVHRVLLDSRVLVDGE